MNKKAKVPTKSRGRPRLRADCEYVDIGISVPAWMARELTKIFLRRNQPSRKMLIEWFLAKCLGYTKDTYAKKCEKEARRESKK